MSEWVELPQVNIPDGLASLVGGHDLVAQTLARRGYHEPQAASAFLDPDSYPPTPSIELPNLELAVQRIEQAIQQGKRILVWGDFDVDGQTSTTLLVAGLRDLGAQVDYHIPVRAQESHGVNLPVLQGLLQASVSPSMLLTCDTGVGSHQAVEYAIQRGLEVVITDHHELPSELPQANALVNPRLLPIGHPLATLPGVGVAYKLMEELYRRAGRQADAGQFLDLVALGIVADVADLRGETRYLLQRGIALLRNPQRLGLQVLMETAGLAPEELNEEHIGFTLAPRLNALGRLGDANPIVELLTTSDRGTARLIAIQLEGLNARRKMLTNQVLRGALAQLDQQPSLLDEAIIVLSHPEWPAGIIGIVASKLVERFRRPVALIATPPGEIGRGSARSIEGLDITAAISEQSSMLVGFGGHRMAAGFGIQAENIPDFRRGLSKSVRSAEVQPRSVLQIDARLELSELNLALVADLERLAPFGPGNPPLLFSSHDVRWISHAFIGRDQEHVLVTVEDDQGTLQRVLWWGGADWLGALGLPPQTPFDLAYTLRASTFRGQRDLQMTWVDFRISDAEAANAQRIATPEVLDFRKASHPMMALNELLRAPGQDLRIWAEAGAAAQLRQTLPAEFRSCVSTRLELLPAARLLIWTCPAGRSELLRTLQDVRPGWVALFAVDPGLDELDPFLKRLAGLVRYALQSAEGRVSLSHLASGMAHRSLAVRLGLDWLVASGHITIQNQDGEALILSKGANANPQAAGQIANDLRLLLEEVAAYRRYYSSVESELLLR